MAPGFGSPLLALASLLTLLLPVGARAGDTTLARADAGPTTVILSLQRREISVERDGLRFGPWPVAVGAPESPTPRGSFAVLSKSVNPRYESTSTGVVHPAVGPASPLGERWIGFLSSGGDDYGIHGTPWPVWVERREAVSHGCVRMLNADVKALYDLVEVGTPVLIRD